jgi:hypothetical protein
MHEKKKRHARLTLISQQIHSVRDLIALAAVIFQSHNRCPAAGKIYDYRGSPCLKTPGFRACIGNSFNALDP